MSECGLDAAAHGLHGRRRGVRKSLERLRLALLSSAAVSLALALPSPAQAQVVVPPASAQCSLTAGGTVADCQGDLSDGLDADGPPLSNLTVSNITGNIAPGLDIRGIDAQTTGDGSPLTIFIDIAPFEIITQGINADGIFAQTDGANSSIMITNRAAITTQGTFVSGISAETSGDGSDITITNQGTITIDGFEAAGIRGRSDGPNSPVFITNWGTITILSDDSTGILAQSVNTDSDITVINRGAITTLSDDSAGIAATIEAGSSSMITIDNGAPITTRGNRSDGISAFTEVAGGPITVTNRAAISTHGNDAVGISTLALFPESPVTVSNWGAISTQRNEAIGIDALTFGADSQLTLTNWAAITTGGNDAMGIDALTFGADSQLTLTNWGAITTQGSDAIGIAAQTVGGRSPVTLTNRGAITTLDSDASGIAATTNGTDSPVRIDNWADVIANGMNADGIRADSADATSTVTINLYGGLVQGGTGDGDGVYLDSAAGIVSALNVFAGATVTTLGDNAVEGSDGDETVNNFGTISGNVDLDDGFNAFNNRAGGLFNAGMTVILGAGNFLENAGTLSPGGLNTPLFTELTGNYVQTATGIFNIDVDFTNGVSDRFDITAPGTALLNGLVVGNFFNPQAVLPGQQGQVTILTTPGGVVTNNGIMAQDTAVVDYTLLFIGNNQVDLTAFIDFSPTGLNQNQTALGETVNAIQTLGGSAAFTPVVAGLLRVPDLASLADAYDQLGPEIYLDNGIATLFSSLDFTDDLMSCEVREGGNVFINEGQCIWAKGSGAWFDQDKTAETIGFDRNAIRFAGGGQIALAPDWRVGMAIGYEHSDLDVLGGRQNSDADTIHGGAVIKYLFGDGLIAAAISGGQGWYDTTRNLAFGGFAGQTTADHDVSHLTGRLRGAYAFTNGAHYIKPMVDLNVTWIDVDGFTEKGGNGAALIVSGTDETVFSVSPAVEIGWQSQTVDGILVRPYVRAGVTVFDDPEFTLTSRFAAVDGAPGFRTQVGTDDVVGDIAAGLDVLATDGSVIKVYYAGQFGDDTSQQSVGARASIPF